MHTAKSVAKNASFLLLGRVISIGLGLVYYASLARYIHAAGLGKIAIATSLVSLLTLLVNFGLSQVIIRDVSTDKAKAQIYVSNSLFLRGVLSIVFVFTLIIVTKITNYPSDTILIIYIYATAYIFDEFTDVAFSIFNASEKMEYMTAIQVGRDIINIVLSLGAIYFHTSLIVIVLISALANLFKLAVSWFVLRWRFTKPSFHLDAQLCRRLFITALPFAALAILSSVHRQIDTVILSFYRPEAEVGWFSAANIPIGYLLLLPSTFLQAIFPVFARFHGFSKSSLQLAYVTSFNYLLLLGVPLCIGTLATADQVISLIYGRGFEKAALSLRISSLPLFWMFGYANGGLLNATGGQKLSASVAGMAALINVLLALWLIPSHGYIGASIAAVAPGILFFFPLTLICHRRVGVGLPYALAAKTLISALCVGAATIFALKVRINLFIALFLIAPIVYALCLLALRAISRADMALLVGLVKGTAKSIPNIEIPPRD
jgi:O-antigen/teichoic acid export membrane protein